MVSEVSSSKCEFLDITGRAMTIKIVPHSLICIQYHEKEEINYLEDKPSLTNSSHTSHCLYLRYSGLLILCFILVSTISFAYFSLLGLTLNECEPILSISFQIYAYINTYMHIYIYIFNHCISSVWSHSVYIWYSEQHNFQHIYRMWTK